MRKIVFILFIGTLLFAINVAFYVLSEDYRFFIKKIKYSDTIVYDNTLDVNDEETFDIIENGTWKKLEEESIPEVVLQDSFTFLEDIKSLTKEPKKKLVMNDIEREILLFFEKYALRKLQKHSSLFDITTEYPDKYFEYYSEELVVYFFSTKSYSEVYDIFEVLSYELPYDVNEINNFWQASFYINLKEVYTDEFIRIVLQYKNTAFWLKINKDVYNELKDVLEPMKAQK